MLVYNNRLRRMVEAGPTDLKPGDEHLEWATYSQLWHDYSVTRGALDVLVQQGEIKWVGGAALRDFLAERLGHHEAKQARAAEYHGDAVLLAERPSWAAWAPEPDQVYYEVQSRMLGYKARDAAQRLSGETPTFQAVTEVVGHNETQLFSELVRCPKCEREVQRVGLRDGGCVVCKPR